MIKEIVLATVVMAAYPSGMPTSEYEYYDQMVSNQEPYVEGYITGGTLISVPFDVYEVEEPVVNGPLPEHLTKSGGVFYGPSGKETYYNLNMSRCIEVMRGMGYTEEEYPYWIREDGVKMFGSYVMVAADFLIRPRGTILETSLGTAIVVDTGSFANYDSTMLDICVAW